MIRKEDHDSSHILSFKNKSSFWFLWISEEESSPSPVLHLEVCKAPVSCLTLLSYLSHSEISLSRLYCTKGIGIFIRACILLQFSHSHNPLFKLMCSKLMLVVCCPDYSLALQEETPKYPQPRIQAILITLPRMMHEPS